MARKMMRAAVVGATTLLGKELLDEISNSAAAVWDVQLLEEGEEVEGQLTAAGDEALVVHALNSAAFTGLDLVFFAGLPELTTRFLTAATKSGAAVVDLTGAAQGVAGFLTRSPWLQISSKPDLTTIGIVVPHPVALILSLVAARLQQQFGHVELAATVLEPASQAGSAGVDELHQQTVGLLSFQEVPKAVFGVQVAFNLQGSLGDEAQIRLGDVRERIEQDLRRVLGEGFDATLSLALLQAPVFHGYMISAHVRLPAVATEDEIRSVLAGGVVVAAEDTGPSNQAAIESGDVLVAVRKVPGEMGAAWLLISADNLRLVARSAVESALELAALRPGTRVQ